MAALSFSFFSTLPRQHLHWNFYPNMKVVQIQDLKLKNKWVLMAVSKEGAPEAIPEELSDTAEKKTGRTSKRAPVSSRRKKVVEASNDEEAENTSGSVEEPRKTRGRTRKKKEIVESSFGDSISDVEGNVTDEVAVIEPESSGKPKKTRRTRKKKETVESISEDSISDLEGYMTDEEALPTSGSSEEPVGKRKRTSRKEAKMFYFNTFSLLDPNMRSTTLRATKISKKLGGVVFYDLNLPSPLWESSDKAKTFIQQAWDLADIIEVTKQELEFLCGIEPSERFDTKDNDRSKFTHYPPEVIAPLWHENLKILFVTNGTSKIHYYTKEHNGSVLGLEDVPLTPYTSDMSASGDGIIAGIIRMLTVQPHLMTDKGYLERTLKYAISCGVVDQWLQARRLGYPPKEGMEDDVAPDDHGIKSVTEREYRNTGAYKLMV